MKRFEFTVLLSASVPSPKRSKKYQVDYPLIKNPQLQIDEAVTVLARTIFQNKGRLIFGAHPSISSLIKSVSEAEFPDQDAKEAEDMFRNDTQSKPILMYQSRAFEKVVPKHTIELYQSGNSDLIWTPAIGDEEFHPEFQGQEQCIESLNLMRKQMINNQIDAMVCIGGMEGLEREFELFRDRYPEKPIFILETTGGASALIAEHARDYQQVNVIDQDFMKTIDSPRNNSEEQFTIIPYIYYSSLIIDRITNSESNEL